MPRGAPPTFTPEQDAAIIRDWTAGVETNAIIEAVNLLPGRRISKHGELHSRVRTLGCKRPPGWQARHLNPTPRIPRSTNPKVAVPIWRLIGLAGELRELGVRVPRDQITDPAVVSAYWRRVEPEHPGFVLVSVERGTGEHGYT